MSLAARLQAAASAHAGRPALSIGGETLSYAELFAAAERCAARLDAVPAGARVGLLAHRSLDAYVGVLALVLSGRPYVPINPKAPPERQSAIAAAAGCGGWLHDDETADSAQALAAGHGGVALAVDPRADGPRDFTAAAARHAYVMFTSGTTGTPKGVAVRVDNVTAYVDAFAQIAAITSDDRCTQFFDLSFDLSVHDMFVTWEAGACLFAPTEAELIDPVGFANRSGASVWFSVPSAPAMAQRMRRLGPGVLPGLRLALFCGEPLPSSLAKAVAAAAPNAEVWNLYGPTEATIAITAERLDPAAQGMPATVPLGAAYAGCAAVVVDDAGLPVPPGGEGELWLAGPQITDGYINNPAEQAAKFLATTIPGYPHNLWYRSGDLVRNDPIWGLVCQGRLDDQVKISGYRVELLEVEEALRRAAGTGEVAAVPWPLNEGGSAEGLVGFVCATSVDARAIAASCRELLPPYMVPKRVIAVEALPLNANGKIDRKALRQRYLERP
ncbi:amino acid adenylation domain-containing protein [Sandarakinorhabdus oryzae]|uniref:amino acid adenylation domain-containing protein n=1 Tax=Sandarakinorhabdus oryzae TaxID=2675220 RepID=UPI0018CC12F1|nr:amino acid adenylation domain-containing protein [Sandarakinorhabdus oryzae]